MVAFMGVQAAVGRDAGVRLENDVAGSTSEQLSGAIASQPLSVSA